jgi:hypothetical protein
MRYCIILCTAIGLFATICFVAASQVAAQSGATRSVTIGSVRVALTTPPGFCALDESNEADARVFDLTRTGTKNKILSIYTDCKQLRDWHGGSRQTLDDMSQYQVSPHESSQQKISDICADLRRRGGDLSDQAKANSNERLIEAAKSVRLNENKFLGVVAEEPNACYAALLQKIAGEAGPKTQFNLFAIVKVKDHLLFYYLISPYDSQSLYVLIAKHKANVAALLAANP